MYGSLGAAAATASQAALWGATYTASATTIAVSFGVATGAAAAGVALIEEMAIDEVMPDLEANGSASDAGEYAGRPWPIRESEMPRYVITGGPKLKYNYNLDEPVYIRPGTPLKITQH